MYTKLTVKARVFHMNVGFFSSCTVAGNNSFILPVDGSNNNNNNIK